MVYFSSTVESMKALHRQRETFKATLLKRGKRRRHTEGRVGLNQNYILEVSFSCLRVEFFFFFFK